MELAAQIKKYSEIVCRVFDGEEILFSTEFDLSNDSNYTEGLFVVGRMKVCIIENNKVVLVENIHTYDEVFCKELNGSGILEVSTNSGKRLLVRFSMKYIEEFNLIAELLNDIISGNFNGVKETYHPKEKVCPNCGNPYITNTEVCLTLFNIISSFLDHKYCYCSITNAFKAFNKRCFGESCRKKCKIFIINSHINDPLHSGDINCSYYQRYYICESQQFFGF